MRTVIRLATGLAVFVLTALAMVPMAVAQTEYEDPPTVLPFVEQAGEVSGAGGTGGTGAEIAFTGFQLTVWMVLLAALVAVGVAALWAGRRRTRAARHAS
jgi:hypothetical protein